MGTPSTVCALLEGGANVNSRDMEKSTPLHRACSQSRVGADEALLCWDADEKLANKDGFTATGVTGAWEEDRRRR